MSNNFSLFSVSSHDHNQQNCLLSALTWRPSQHTRHQCSKTRLRFYGFHSLRFVGINLRDDRVMNLNLWITAKWMPPALRYRSWSELKKNSQIVEEINWAIHYEFFIFLWHLLLSILFKQSMSTSLVQLLFSSQTNEYNFSGVIPGSHFLGKKLHERLMS